MIKRLWNWLSNFFGKKEEPKPTEKVVVKFERKIPPSPEGTTPELLRLKERARELSRVGSEDVESRKERLARQEWLPKPPKPDLMKKLRLKMRAKRLPKPTSKAVHADIGRYMRGKGQHKGYRRSVKARVQPEDD